MYKDKHPPYIEDKHILKILKDNQYAKYRSEKGFQPKSWLKWGLGIDGNLYTQCQISGYGYYNPNEPNIWYRADFYIDFYKMKQLVEYFK